MLLKFTYVLCSILCPRTGIVVRLLCYLYAILHEHFTTCSRQFLFMNTVLLKCINERIKVYHYALSCGDSSIRVYQLFTTIFHKCLILLLTFILHFLLMLALCLMLSMTHYAKNYAGIIGKSLLPTCLPAIRPTSGRRIVSFSHNTEFKCANTDLLYRLRFIYCAMVSTFILPCFSFSLTGE